jgi:RND family efflux transporter MFP subunit
MAAAVAADAGARVGTLRQARDARGFLAQWLLLLVARAPFLSSALVLSLDDAGALVPAAMWPEAVGDISALAAPAQRCVDERRDVVEALPDAPGTRGRARHVLASPVFLGEQLIAAVVLVASGADGTQLQRLLAEVQWGAGWIEALHRQRGTQLQAQALERSRLALDMLALLGGHERVDDACAAMAAELARASGCERVAVGLAGRRGMRLCSLSHAAWFERRSALARALEAAMGEAVEQRAALQWPPAEGADRTLVAAAQQALAQEGQAALTVPILAGARAVGAVTWQLDAARLTPEFTAQAQALAVVLGPLLARLQDQSRWWAGRAPTALACAWRALSDRRRPGFAVAAVLVLALLAGFTLMDVPYRVTARAALEGRVQRVVAAPFEGFVAEAPARAGQTVKAGTLLARLDDRDLRLEQARLSAELTQQDKKRAEALARHDRAELSVLSAQVAESEARLAQVQERLERTRIEAPFDGVLVSGDLSQQLGSPVEQGKTLFEIAPLAGWRVALKVDERDVRQVHPGQRGALLLSGQGGEALPFTVRHVSVAGVEEGQNLFRVEAELDGAPAQLRPGMEGVGKVEAGAHSLGWIWTHRFVDWLRLTWWRWVP